MRLAGATHIRPAFTVGIGGGSGSGKSILAQRLLSAFTPRSVCLLDLDSYYLDRTHLSQTEKMLLNYDEPQAIDHELLLRHLTGLIRGEAVRKPIYCFETHARKLETTTLGPAEVILVEGIFAFWSPTVRQLLDCKIYLDADADIRFIRRAKRDVVERGRTMESVIDQYLTTVRPMHETYVEPTRLHADVALCNNSHDLTDLFTSARVAIEQFANGHKRPQGCSRRES
ncbi:MAG: uridine kinase [Candidatus Acidiferrales bacterium]